MNIDIFRKRERYRGGIEESESWIERIIDTVHALLEKGGTPEIALVSPPVFEKVRDEIKDRIEYGYAGQAFGKDYGTFIHVDGWKVEIISERYLNASILVGERRGLLPEESNVRR